MFNLEGIDVFGLYKYDSCSSTNNKMLANLDCVSHIQGFIVCVTETNMQDVVHHNKRERSIYLSGSHNLHFDCDLDDMVDYYEH